MQTRTLEVPVIDAEQVGRVFVERLRATRRERGWTGAELALRGGLSGGIVSRLERGENAPAMATLVALSATLGVSPCWLIGAEELCSCD